MLGFRRRRFTDPGPSCDRCDKPTGKPHLWLDPCAWWRCDPCEREVTRIIFEHAAAGRSVESLLPYTRRHRHQP